MALLKFEVDTDEIFQDYDEQLSFEDLVKGAISETVKKEMVGRFSEKAIEGASKPIALECIYQVERKIANLLNEDIVIDGRWGEPKFIGTVEDYIKQEIDGKLLKQVDSNGKKLTGTCSTNENSWVEWKVGKMLGRFVNKQFENVEYYINKDCKVLINKAIEKFQTVTLKTAITKKLEEVGVIPSEEKS